MFRVSPQITSEFREVPPGHLGPVHGLADSGKSRVIGSMTLTKVWTAHGIKGLGRNLTEKT